ncbi:M56 family metallopeptidase [Micromonospora sp. MED01]|uniref:M56 family metallopeptidase n=1 Tax=Micromonospora alfalfae TaxID=2911212 RepID=UPI001EE7E3CA|nr:M56 family metallopeptidase [Micromonospora alfalfae]MCG5466588.1 M56 family metallopeptidase [Micromonospora alfalfae]
MNAGVALLVGALVVAWLAPPLLECVTGRQDPFAVLLSWCGAIVAVIGSFALGVVLLLVPRAGAQGWTETLAHHCWVAMRHGHLPAQHELVGALGALTAGVLITRTVVSAVRQRRAQRASHQAHRDLLALLGGPPTALARSVLSVPHTTPIAYSIGGRDGLVVLSTGVQQLPPAQRAAVLSHERAHLRGRHHLLVAAAEILAAAIPWVPITRQAPRAVRVLVELCADADAVRACGASAVRGALIALAGSPSPAGTLSMAGADVPLRLHHLREDRCTHKVPSRLLLPLAATAAPAFIGLLAVLTFCP